MAHQHPCSGDPAGWVRVFSPTGKQAIQQAWFSYRCRDGVRDSPAWQATQLSTTGTGLRNGGARISASHGTLLDGLRTTHPVHRSGAQSQTQIDACTKGLCPCRRMQACMHARARFILCRLEFRGALACSLLPGPQTVRPPDRSWPPDAQELLAPEP